jgi:hypothetical protein
MIVELGKFRTWLKPVSRATKSLVKNHAYQKEPTIVSDIENI